MNKELLAALRRIGAIAHYYSEIAGYSDEIIDGFRGILDEAEEAIDLAKNSNPPDLLIALENLLEDSKRFGLSDSEYSGSIIEAGKAIAKAKA